LPTNNTGMGLCATESARGARVEEQPAVSSTAVSVVEPVGALAVGGNAGQYQKRTERK